VTALEVCARTRGWGLLTRSARVTVFGWTGVCRSALSRAHRPTPRHATPHSAARPSTRRTLACCPPAPWCAPHAAPSGSHKDPFPPLPPQPFPDPKSQSFSRSYGSVLPTSLTHIILVTRGCSPWRPAADMSTDSQGNDHLPLIFKDCYRHTRHLRDGRCSSNHLTLSPDNLIQGSSKKERKKPEKKKEIPPKESERERERERQRRRRRRRNRERRTREQTRERGGGRGGKRGTWSLPLSPAPFPSVSAFRSALSLLALLFLSFSPTLLLLLLLLPSPLFVCLFFFLCFFFRV